MNSRSFNSSSAKGSALAVAVGVAVVAGLLVLPMIALHRAGVNLIWAGAYCFAISVLTYWTYARDKQHALQGEWRISEYQLHVWELLGGWPGAWIAQRRLRHKCSKGSYQVVFWLIVVGYQFAAFDSLQDWRYSRAGLKWIEQASGPRYRE